MSLLCLVQHAIFPHSPHTSLFLSQPLINRHHFAYMSSDMLCGVNDSHFERLSLSLVAPKFDSLADLYHHHAPSSFYIVKLWTNMHCPLPYGLHAVASRYESKESRRIRCSTTVFSFGKAVVEKTQYEDPVAEGDSFVYYCNHSPMCEYMVHFIDKLRRLDSPDKMNLVLENFSVLQVLTDANTNQLLMCTGFLFAVSATGAPQHAIFRLAGV